ncbi:MAG TPA: heme exporter protein CcmB [Candidatus Kapabacteria bacterium]|nr:heme exporter protein CcmB [Candidatus Kapabacteria bacterium]
MSLLSESFAITVKDIRSELRTRYNLIAIVLFVVTSVTTVVFSIGDEKFTPELSAGLLWILLIFGSMTGLARCFVVEEERGTRILLQISSRSLSVYYGKLFFNIIIGIFLNGITFLLFLLFLPIEISSWWYALLSMSASILGLASASTIIAAIIAQAQGRAILFPVLMFPILLPIILVGLETSVIMFSATFLDPQYNMVIVELSYAVILITVSTFLFDYVWTE